MPEPTSAISAARSRTVTSQPIRRSAIAVVTPPMPPPTTSAVVTCPPPRSAATSVRPRARPPSPPRAGGRRVVVVPVPHRARPAPSTSAPTGTTVLPRFGQPGQRLGLPRRPGQQQGAVVEGLGQVDVDVRPVAGLARRRLRGAGPSRTISADWSAEHRRSAGARTATPSGPSRRPATSASHSPRRSRRSAVASAARRAVVREPVGPGTGREQQRQRVPVAAAGDPAGLRRRRAAAPCGSASPRAATPGPR